jgi:para-nitrobenzyl esterase
MSGCIRTVFLFVIVWAVAGPFGPDIRGQESSCFVSAPAGLVQGRDNGDSCAFLGIPYVAPPIGALRWKPPQTLPPWAGIRDATVPPTNCSTINFPAGTLGGVEDCLKLNIWVSDPLPSAPAPVIVWIHTGAFFGASANFPGHDGRRLVEETGVIVVMPQYRLGPFGFLAHAALAAEGPGSGNFGLLDQQAALRWVRDNIAAFGGDPSNVTIAGTSAGGDSVGLQLVSPGSDGLFHRAIVQSGTPTIKWPTHTEAAVQGAAFATALGCTTPATVTDCMRSKTRAEVLVALMQATQQVKETPPRVYWQPVVDGVVIPAQPRELFEGGLFSRVPVMAGTTRDEGWGNFINRSFSGGPSLAQYEAWVGTEFGLGAGAVLAQYPAASFPSPAEAMARVVGDGLFACETQRLARAVSDTHDGTVFVFSYEHVVDELAVGKVIHGVEGNILFGNRYVPPIFANHVLDATDEALHAEMAEYWTAFARTGTPNGGTSPGVHWPQFKDPAGLGRGSHNYLVLDSNIRPDKRLREPQCDFWSGFFLRTMLGSVPAGTP